MKKLFTMLGICLLLVTACENEKESNALQEYQAFTFSNQLEDTCTVGDILKLSTTTQFLSKNLDFFVLTIKKDKITYLLILTNIEGVIIPTRWSANGVSNIEWKSFELRMYNTYMESKFFTSSNQLDSSITKTK